MSIHNIILLTEAQRILPKIYRHHPEGMLPLADKPLAIYLIETLASQGYRHITIALSAQTKQVVNLLGNGNLWGVHLNYIDCDNERSIDIMLHENAQSAEQATEYRVLNCRCLADIVLVDNQKNAAASTNSSTTGNDLLALFTTQEPEKVYQLIKQQPDNDIAKASADNTKKLDYYLSDNMRVLSKKDSLLLQGFEKQPDFFVNQGCTYGAVNGGTVYIGQNAHIHPGSTIQEQVIIGTDSVIQENVTLNNTLVLPNTYVGENLDLSNCIASHSWVYNTVTNGLIFITDPALLSAA